MLAECNTESFSFHALGRRDVVARFDGGRISSDAGGLLLRETERITGIIRQFANCFTDHRDPDRIEHTVEQLIAQRVYGLALGYEDLNDHDDLRHDPLLAVLVNKSDPLGTRRKRSQDKGKALAGKSTLNRLELTPVRAGVTSRYKKITLNRQAVQRLFTDVFLQAHQRPPQRIVLDLDATDTTLHGRQAGRFFHGYYKSYCYLPLYIFCGEHLLCARMRPSNIDAAAGSVKELQRIVEQIRRRWPKVKIMIRADSGFCREAIMAWCEANDVDFVLGLGKNDRLNVEIESELEQARCEYEAPRQAARVFKDFDYRTLDSWSCARRVVGKAEHLAKGANPRFVVTSLSAEAFEARSLYEEQYCARGEMENRIKEQQLCLFADRASASSMRANELRLWFASIGYTLMNALRRLGLANTKMARARCDTIRSKLLKIGARLRVTFRKVWVSMTESCPYQHVFRQVYDTLVGLRPILLRC